MESARGAGVARFLASWRALAVVAVVITALALSGVRVMHQQIALRAFDSATTAARTVQVLVVARELTVQDMLLTVDRGKRQAMDADVILLQGEGAILGLRVWSMVDGRLVYSDAAHRNSPEPEAAAIAAVRASKTYAMDVAGGVAVYLPYDVTGDQKPDAAIEVLIPRTRIDLSVNRASRWLYGMAAFVLLALLLILFMIRRHQNSQDFAATHDGLTGLGNRALLHRRARGLLGRASAEEPAGLLLIDLDGFKGVNDTLGHHAGDELLVVVAQRLAAAAGAQVLPIRLGGDEFAVLTGGPDALALATELYASLREPMLVAGVPVEIDASIGVAFAPEHATEVVALLRHADLAMYEAKRNGAGVIVFRPGTQHAEEQHVTLVPELRRALSENELELFYQPVCAPDGDVDTVEALLRWRHPSRGLLTADEFVPQVAKTSLIKELSAWVIGTALTDGAGWRAQGRSVRLAVNVSLQELTDPALPQRLRSTAEATGFPLTELQLEVAEAALASRGADEVADAIDELHRLGVQVTIDDVGSAYHALFALERLSVDAVKIHPRFTRSMAASPHAASVVRHLVQLTHDSDARCIAAGVEGAADWALLTLAGCDGVQGYVASEPLPAALLWATVDEWNGGRPREAERVDLK
ncbi:EAL domain-containing protein [Actinoplanes sp. NPDC051411]|uniref:putative bifunctional diguanylate cyclase/phosphodiesterase n=1 Tax=Actinoplanes sp. NPDC051411 TaxID=3155522 RepID=UPI00344593AA